jgi:hypothetical protein
MAGSPAFVPGTLMKALGRCKRFHRWRASWTVPSVSCASFGDTSSDT